jgi:hypothetical protein
MQSCRLALQLRVDCIATGERRASPYRWSTNDQRIAIVFHSHYSFAGLFVAADNTAGTMLPKLRVPASANQRKSQRKSSSDDDQSTGVRPVDHEYLRVYQREAGDSRGNLRFQTEPVCANAQQDRSIVRWALVQELFHSDIAKSMLLSPP